MHENSIKAYREGNGDGTISTRANIVFGVVRRLGICTDRQVKEALSFREMNAVRPRITELIKSGHLEQYGVTVDNVTKKTVRTVRVKLFKGYNIPSYQPEWKF